MKTLEDVFALLEVVEQKLDRLAVPFDDQLWDTADVARYFKRNPQVARETITCQPSFPKAIRLPSSGKARPLYVAGEVVAWAKKHKEKN
jgi:hypothetical protein